MAEHALDGEMRLSSIGWTEHGGDAGTTGAEVAAGCGGEGNRHQMAASSRSLPGMSVPQCDGQGAVASLCLICGTSLERIEPESLTRSLSDFVHGYISVQESVGTLELVKPSWKAALRSIKLVNLASQATSGWSIPGIEVS